VHAGKKLISAAILLVLWGACLTLHALPMAAAADSPQSGGLS